MPYEDYPVHSPLKHVDRHLAEAERIVCALALLKIDFEKRDMIAMELAAAEQRGRETAPKQTHGDLPHIPADHLERLKRLPPVVR